MALIFDEDFETPISGYKETASGIGSNWAETIGASCTLAPATLTSGVTGAPSRWGDQCLKIVQNGNATFTINTFDTGYATLYGRIDLIVNTITITDGDYTNIGIIAHSTGTTGNILIQISRSGANYYLRFILANTTLTEYQITFDQPYRIDFYYPNASTGEIKVTNAAGTTTSVGTATCATGTLINILFGRPANGTVPWTIFYDLIQLATDGWIPADSSESASISASTSATESASISPSESSSASATTEINLEQEGFRFRNDDGDEAGATWLGEQDAGATIMRNTNYRLRFVVNALSGDAPSTQFKLQYKKTSDEVWLDVPSSE